MATYYARKIGSQWKIRSGDWPSDAVGTNASSNNIQGCCNDVDGSTHTLVVYPGVYQTTDISATGQLATAATGLSLRGPLPEEATGEFVLDGTGGAQSIVKIGHTGWNVSRLKIQNVVAAGKYAIDTDQSIVSDRLSIVNCSRGMLLRNGGTFSRLFLSGTLEDFSIYMLTNAAVYTFNNSFILNPRHATKGYITPAAEVVLNMNNCIMAGFRGWVITPETGRNITVTLNNCGLIWDDNFGQKQAINAYSTGTWVLNNCWGGTSAAGAGRLISSPSASTTITNMSAAYWPGFSGSRRSGRFTVSVDDSPNYSVWRQVADLANQYGVKCFFGVSWYGNENLNWTALAADIANGHEVCCHARSDFRLGSTSAFTLAKSASSVVISVTRTNPNDSTTWTGTLTLTGESPIDLASSSYNTMYKLKAWLASKGVTITTPSGQTDYSVDHGEKTLCLESGTYSIGTATTIPLNQVALFQVEITEAKAWLESQIRQHIPAWTATSFMWPGGSWGTAAGDAILAAGFECGRGTVGATGVTYLTKALDITNVGALFLDDTSLGTTEEGLRANLLGHLFSVADQGAVSGVYGHAWSSWKWETVFEALRDSTDDVVNDTMTGSVRWVRDGEDHLTGRISYRASDETDNGWDNRVEYELAAVSPLIGAGVDVSLTTDFDGNAVPGAVGYDIGPYSYMPGWTVSDGVLPVDGQVFKSHALPIAAKKVTVFPGVASQAQINEAKE